MNCQKSFVSYCATTATIAFWPRGRLSASIRAEEKPESGLRKIFEASQDFRNFERTCNFHFPLGLSSYIKNLQENNKQTRNNSSQFLQSLKASLLAQKSAITVKVNLIILRTGLWLGDSLLTMAIYKMLTDFNLKCWFQTKKPIFCCEVQTSANRNPDVQPRCTGLGMERKNFCEKSWQDILVTYWPSLKRKFVRMNSMYQF